MHRRSRRLHMEIRRTRPEERDQILDLYAHASALQRSKGQVTWPQIDPALVDLEIREGRQWQIRLDGHMACVWVVAYEDPQIWGKLDADPSIYLHRIATHPDFRGRKMVGHVVRVGASARGRGRKDPRAFGHRRQQRRAHTPVHRPRLRFSRSGGP